MDDMSALSMPRRRLPHRAGPVLAAIAERKLYLIGVISVVWYMMMDYICQLSHNRLWMV